MSRRHRLTGTLLAFAVIVGAAYPASAAPISASFSGTINAVSDPGGELDPVIQMGAMFTVSYTIETDAAVPGPCRFVELGPNGCVYAFTGMFASLTIEDSIYIASSVRVFIDDFPSFGPYPDRWFLFFVADPLAFSLLFFDNTATRLLGPSFFVNTSLEGWDGGELLIERGSSGGVFAEGTIIPEPGTLPLALPAIILVLAYRAGRGSRRDHGS